VLTFRLTRDFEVDFGPMKALEKGDTRASAAESNAQQAEIEPKSPSSLIVNTP
jgi:hypothetical protein